MCSSAKRFEGVGAYKTDLFIYSFIQVDRLVGGVLSMCDNIFDDKMNWCRACEYEIIIMASHIVDIYVVYIQYRSETINVTLYYEIACNRSTNYFRYCIYTMYIYIYVHECCRCMYVELRVPYGCHNLSLAVLLFLQLPKVLIYCVLIILRFVMMWR